MAKKNIQQNKIPQNNISQPIDEDFRQPTFTIVIGEMGYGKTYGNEIDAARYLKGDPAKGVVPRKVLYSDINNEFGHVQTIPVDYAFDILKKPEERQNFPNWILVFSDKRAPVEARRAIPIKSDGYPMTNTEINIMLSYLITNFHGGLLIVEDPTKTLSNSIKVDITGGLANIRHRNCDIIANFQYISKATHPGFWGTKTYVKLYKTSDSFRKYADKIVGEEEILYLAETLVKSMNEKRRKNATAEDIRKEKQIPIERFFCTIDFRSKKIRGAFNRNDFQEAIEKYVRNKQNKALEELLNELDPDNNGKPVYTFRQAYDIKLKELMQKYYGNER